MAGAEVNVTSDVIRITSIATIHEHTFAGIPPRWNQTYIQLVHTDNSQTSGEQQTEQNSAEKGRADRGGVWDLDSFPSHACADRTDRNHGNLIN